jgi:hypothetical protein
MKSPALARPIAAILCASAGWSADTEVVHHLRLNLGSPPSPEVEEKVSGITGVKDTTYIWQGEQHTQFQAGIEAVRMAVGPYGGSVLGLGLVHGRYLITPEGYKVDNTVIRNATNTRLGHQTFGLQTLAGWQCGATADSGRTHLIGELAALFGGGLAWAQTENLSVLSGQYETNRGRGWYYEYGLRGGVYLVERGWFLGVTSAYVTGRSWVRADTVDGGRSDLRLDRAGWSWSGVLGTSF